MMNYLKMFFPILALVVTTSALADEVATSTLPVTATTTSTDAAMISASMSAPDAAQLPANSASPAASPTAMSPAEFHQFLTTIKAKRRAAEMRKHMAPPPKQPAPPPMTYEQGQQAMLSTLPRNDATQASDESNMAFEALMQQNMPMTPEQVVKMRQRIDLSQRASAITPNIPPKSVSSTIMVNLAPGATPPAVRLSQGYVSSLVFVDSTGTPWPIASFDIGNPKSVNMQWDGKSNILLIQSVAPYISGDIVVRLVGLPTPITLELVSGQRVVDYRVDIHVSGIGPNTKELPLGTDLPNSANQLLLGVLDGVAPAGSRALNVTGASNTQVWLLGDKMYMRTRFTVLSPGWVGKMVSPDGMIAYEIPKTSTVLISRYGEPVQLKVEGL